MQAAYARDDGDGLCASVRTGADSAATVNHMGAPQRNARSGHAVEVSKSGVAPAQVILTRIRIHHGIQVEILLAALLILVGHDCRNSNSRCIGGVNRIRQSHVGRIKVGIDQTAAGAWWCGIRSLKINSNARVGCGEHVLVSRVCRSGCSGGGRVDCRRDFANRQDDADGGCMVHL